MTVSEIGSSTQGKMPIKSQGVDKNILDESLQCSSALTHSGSSVSRPSSNYSARSQQAAGSQKGKDMVSCLYSWCSKVSIKTLTVGKTKTLEEDSTFSFLRGYTTLHICLAFRLML